MTSRSTKAAAAAISQSNQCGNRVSINTPPTSPAPPMDLTTNSLEPSFNAVGGVGLVLRSFLMLMTTPSPPWSWSRAPSVRIVPNAASRRVRIASSPRTDTGPNEWGNELCLCRTPRCPTWPAPAWPTYKNRDAGNPAPREPHQPRTHYSNRLWYSGQQCSPAAAICRWVAIFSQITSRRLI